MLYQPPSMFRSNKVSPPSSEYEAIELFLMKGPMPDAHGGAHWVVESALSAALRDARGATNRCVLHGEPALGGATPSWLGAAGYFGILDQLSTALTSTGTHEPQFRVLHEGWGSPIIETSDVPKIKALWALRCAFMHDFGLVNQGRGRTASELTHIFNLTMDDATDAIVELPAKRWERTGAPTAENKTRVSLVGVGNLVERTVSNLRRRFATAPSSVSIGLAPLTNAATGTVVDPVDYMWLRYFLRYDGRMSTSTCRCVRV